MVELSTRKWEIGGNHHEKLGLREFRVRVNWPSPIWQVRVPIRRELTPIRGLSNPIRQLLPLISHIRSYRPYHSHLHPHLSLTCPQLNHHRRTHSKVIALYLSMTWSWVDTEYSIHRVQHPPKIVCLPFILMITSWPLNVAPASGVPPYMIPTVAS